MVRRFFSVSILFLGLASLGCTAKNPLQGSRQLLVVCTGDWDQFQGKMQRFERDSQGPWKPVGDMIEVCLGKNGLGWGLGLHPKVTTAPQKREGDVRAPAGVFKISAVFSKTTGGTYKMPSIPVGPDTEAIDDPGSRYYNTIVEAHSVAKDWHSSEDMYNIDLYDLGAVVDHNMPVQDREAGSCIFMHAWRGRSSPSAGCTAMTPADLKVVCDWFDSAKVPLLIQLPIQVYEQYMNDWQLPNVSFAKTF